jgi:Secretion system C-terminal sorting domain
MKPKNLHVKSLTALVVCSAMLIGSANGQMAVRKSAKAYAFTSDTRGTASWNTLRLVDLSTGEVTQTLGLSNNGAESVFDAASGRAIKNPNTSGYGGYDFMSPVFGTGVAACAYDRVHNRLYYTPMRVDQLRYIDLNEATPKVYYVQSKKINPGGHFPAEALVITRMVIGADGMGYALTNDATHLIQFTTDRNPDIVDLGTLTDHEKNGGVSVHNMCTSWGGDMVAAADGSLYLFTMRNHVFKIDPRSRIAELKGSVTGLDKAFTTNGAAVDNNGVVFLGSASTVDGLYSVDMESLAASKVNAANGENIYNLSDLATGNLLGSKPPANAPAESKVVKLKGNSFIGLSPNPATNGFFNITFDVEETGRYTIQMVDIMGRVLKAKEVNVSYKKQVERFNYDNKANGVYIIRVVNANNETVMSDKVEVQ